MADVIYKVLDLESPFQWRPLIREENRYEFEFELEDVETFSFLNFCARISLCYYYFTKKNVIQAAISLKEAEEKIVGLDNSKDELYVKSKAALYHVLFACKALMAIQGDGNDDGVLKLLKNIQLFSEMNDSNKAALLAIKACAHSLYNNDGLDMSLSFINMALSHDKATPYWSFLKGTFLQKQRPPSDVPNIQEKEAFDYAHKSDSTNPIFMVYFADTLRETCNNSKRRHNSYLWFIAKSAQVNAEEEIKKKYQKAVKLYSESYELKPSCPVIALKCANGLMRLPAVYQDIKLIKTIISDCEKKFPNSGFGNLIYALYHERINKKIDRSRKCLEKCIELNVFTGCMNAIRLDFKEKNENPKIIERMEKMLEIFREIIKQEIIISQIVSYYVFVTAEIEKACEYMLKYYKRKSDGLYLQKHQSIFEMTDGPVSLVDVITDQVKLKLRDVKIPKETRRFYNNFVSQMNFHNVDVLKGSPKNLLEQIKKSAVPKRENPNKARSNEAHRNSSVRRNSFQFRERERKNHVPRNGEPVQRREVVEGSPRDRRIPKRNASVENVSRNDASPRRYDERYPENKFHRQHMSTADRRPKMASKFEERIPSSSSSLSQSALSNRKEDVDKKAAEPNDDTNEYKVLMQLCSETDAKNIDAILEKWKQLTLKNNDKNKAEEKVCRRGSEKSDEQRQAKRFDGELRDAVAKGKSRRSEDGSPVQSKSHRRRDRSKSADSDRDRKHKRHHRKHKKKHRSSGSEDGSDAPRRHRRSPSPSRRHRRHSNDRHGRKSHRKRRSSASASDSERSTNRKREKEHSHRSKNNHSSTERHHEKRRSHRDHEKSEKSRRSEKESKKRYSDSERDDSR